MAESDGGTHLRSAWYSFSVFRVWTQASLTASCHDTQLRERLTFLHMPKGSGPLVPGRAWEPPQNLGLAPQVFEQNAPNEPEMSASTIASQAIGSVRHIPLLYSAADSRPSALRLLFALNPDWEESRDQIELIQFQDGITNNLYKCIRKLPEVSEEEIDEDAVLLRAFGNGTDAIIDRESV